VGGSGGGGGLLEEAGDECESERHSLAWVFAEWV
jgi:hypothetical protein